LEYFLTDEQKEYQGTCRQIAEERVRPVRAELDEKEEFPWDIVRELAASDMYRVFIPEEYEGLGGGTLELCLVVEELARVCSGVAVTYAASALGCITIIEYGTEAQKQKYLPGHRQRQAAGRVCHNRSPPRVQTRVTSGPRRKRWTAGT
jgi:butyryl-CoA dehydrogenase